MRSQLLFVILFSRILLAGDLSRAPEAEILANYGQLRAVALDPGRVALTENFAFTKDAATFEFKRGNLYFFQSVAEHVAGAIFLGDGALRLKPPTEIERKNLARFTDDKTELAEPFSEAVFLFSDGTFDELSRGLKFHTENTVPGKAASVLESFRETFREDLRANLEARVLAGLCFREHGIFLADIKGQKHGKLLFQIDPQEDEAISLTHYNNSLDYFDVWCSFPQAGKRLTKAYVDAARVDINAAIDKGRKLSAEAKTEFTALVDGPRMLQLHLAAPLRVAKAAWGAAAGTELKFIQEPKKKDADLWVILPEPLVKGRGYTLTLAYAGDEVVRNAGDGNFYVGARASWYPRLANPGDLLSDRSEYHMKFTVPKGAVLVGTGISAGLTEDGKSAVSEWTSGQAFPVAGFNYGKFKTKSQKEGDIEITVYANQALGNELQALRLALEQDPAAGQNYGITPGGLNTTRMADQMLVDAVNSIRVFTHYFGPIPYKTLSITQQPSDFYGQSWPTLVFMPYTAFLDQTMQHQLGMSSGSDRQFLDEVGSHEIAHQWWGHLVGTASYHDEWLSEGFAQYSAGIYTHRIEGAKKFAAFMQAQRNDILQATGDGEPAPNTAGPIWLGERLSAEKSLGAYSLVYAKGAYVLHMLRMMLFDFARNDDSKFVAMMREFVSTFSNKNATTEDFKSVVDKHFGEDMSWFFNQWVYGTEVPNVRVDYSFAEAEGKPVLKGTIRQSGVSPQFRIRLPLIMRFKAGVMSGKITANGEATPFEIRLPERPESVDFNPLNSVLCNFESKKS